MTEISLPEDSNRERDRRKERNATVCSCCFWVIVLLFAYFFFAYPSEFVTPQNALGYLVMFPVMLILLFVSLYKIGKAILQIYKVSGS